MNTSSSQEGGTSNFEMELPSSQQPRDSTMDFETDENSAATTTNTATTTTRNTTPTRVREFMHILEQLPRLCSPTICGTLSQPTTRNERASCGADMFEWSIEQKALLSPANITEDWQNAAIDLDPSWRKQESDMFFSQKTIAPSPLVMVQDMRARTRRTNRSIEDDFMMPLCEEPTDYDDDDDDDRVSRNDNDQQDDEDNDTNNQGEHDDDDDDNLTEYYMDDDEHNGVDDDDEPNDDLLFSPVPVSSSSQKMDVFSPATFSRVMEDENTLQSTPKTTGLSKPVRTRMNILD